MTVSHENKTLLILINESAFKKKTNKNHFRLNCTLLLDFKLFYTNNIIFSVPPIIWIQNQMVGAYEGQQVTLECYTEALPKPINYWTTDTGEIVPQSTF